MARPKGQGKTPGSGRQRGSTNKATADVKALALKHVPAAIKKLEALMDSDDERVRVAAIKEMLDRGCGRPAQPHTGEDGDGPIKIEVELVKPPSG